jgi:glycine/D-amino acid oxidase-like deaminating enzyme
MTPRRAEPVSFWMSRLGRPDRPVVTGDLDVDVCIVGAGYTGLWTGYYLAAADPSLRIAVVEAEHVGFGASGRNGGWASAKLAGLDRALADPSTRDEARRLQLEMHRTLDEMASAIASEAIECDFHRGGTVLAATRPSQVHTLKRAVAIKHGAGFGPEHLRWLEPDEARDHIRPCRLFGATYTPHCAALDPAKLVLGLAAACEAKGVRIFERSAATLAPGGARTPGGFVRAPVVVRATEAYRQDRRAVIPVYSLMVVTEPLGDEAWAAIGLADRETFADARHMIVYGQRTADGRIAFGGRGAPYHYASRVLPGFDDHPRVFAHLEDTLRDLFPVLDDVGFEAAWGGPLAIPRDWRPSVRFDPGSGVAHAGGYVGQGVAAANLAGRTLRDLILEHDTDLTTLSWVGHGSRRWEPEPLRWIGVNLGRVLTESIDRAEDAGHRPRIRHKILDRLPIG